MRNHSRYSVDCSSFSTPSISITKLENTIPLLLGSKAINLELWSFLDHLLSGDIFPMVRCKGHAFALPDEDKCVLSEKKMRGISVIDS